MDTLVAYQAYYYFFNNQSQVYDFALRDFKPNEQNEIYTH